MQCFSGDAEQHDFLAALRTLVCLLPLTAQTENSLNIDTLGRLWPGGYLSHLAGGGHLVETDLLALLGSGQLAGATLDVLSHGSLPASSLFWRHAKVTLTPHTAARALHGESMAQIADKTRALHPSEAAASVVNFKQGYWPHEASTSRQTG